MNNWKRNIAFFITGQTISLIGSLFVQYAIMWYITLNTQSGIMMTISILCGFVPGLILAPFAGVWADRFNRKSLIIVADAFIAILTLITAFIFMFGYREIWLLFVVSVFRSLGQAIHQPSVSSVYPQIVPEDKLMRVQGVSQGIQSAMMVIAPIIGASLLTFTSLEVIFSIDFFTAALAIASLLFLVKIPKPIRHDSNAKIDYLFDIKMGLKYIKSHHFLIPFFTYIAIVMFFVAPAAFLSPLQVVRRFGDEVWRLSAIEIAFSAGMTVGGLIVGAWGGFKNRIYTMVFSLAFMGLSTMLFGIVGSFWVYIAVMVFMGLNLPFYNTPAIVMIQEKVEPDYMGRVFSVLGMINSSAMPLGMLFFGPLADYIAIEWLMLISGFVMMIMGLTILMNKGLVKAGEVRKKQIPITEDISLAAE